MDDPGMVSMFEALVASGLRGFLGCPAIVYEDALVDFFENASVRSGVVISTVGADLSNKSSKRSVSTNSNDAASQRSCNCVPAGQQQPSQRKTISRVYLSIVAKSAVGVIVRFQQMVCDQQLNACFAKEVYDSVLISWNDVVGVHCFVSADEYFSRYFVEEFSSWLSLLVEDCDTTAFDLVGTTAY
ncbi:hypothetical protein F511_43048 [Dorcoceras hygrometricum]|uniref:Uncharacterized protein n=1 Tax=Dorcoceras hygrometricum TaxID=472368 RepID=A0A2Z7B5J8_9LAMI|nr:hypothetical protein F511_43048 [Dorcoceras hygrometricum]